MEFSPTLLAIVPPLLAILLAVITRQVVLSLFIAVFVGAVMLCGGNLWEGFYSTFFDYILPGFEDTDHQRILALTTFCGGFVAAAGKERRCPSLRQCRQPRRRQDPPGRPGADLAGRRVRLVLRFHQPRAGGPHLPQLYR